MKEKGFSAKFNARASCKPFSWRSSSWQVFYFLHVETWVGTPKEILSLLVLAFMTDLTADGVLKALK